MSVISIPSLTMPGAWLFFRPAAPRLSSKARHGVLICKLRLASRRNPPIVPVEERQETRKGGQLLAGPPKRLLVAAVTTWANVHGDIVECAQESCIVAAAASANATLPYTHRGSAFLESDPAFPSYLQCLPRGRIPQFKVAARKIPRQMTLLIRAKMNLQRCGCGRVDDRTLSFPYYRTVSGMHRQIMKIIKLGNPERAG